MFHLLNFFISFFSKIFNAFLLNSVYFCLQIYIGYFTCRISARRHYNRIAHLYNIIVHFRFLLIGFLRTMLYFKSAASNLNNNRSSAFYCFVGNLGPKRNINCFWLGIVTLPNLERVILYNILLTVLFNKCKMVFIVLFQMLIIKFYTIWLLCDLV